MKNAASLLIFLCALAAFAIAGDFKTEVITTSTGPFLLDVPDHHFLRIYNFTQDGGTMRGVVIAAAATPTPIPTATPTPTPTPTPIQTDLTATKTDNVGGHATFPNPWTWKITIANSGGMSGSFPSGQTILSDNLPNSTITYGMPSVSNAVSVTNSSSINCSITGSDLTCTASGATVMIGSGGSFDISFSANATATGSYANPRVGGGCSVDPGNVVPESNEGNNACADTVVSGTPTPAPTPTPPPRAVMTATIISSNSASAPEFIKHVIIDGPTQITVTCPDLSATCVLTYKREPESTPTTLATATPTPTTTTTSTSSTTTSSQGTIVFDAAPSKDGITDLPTPTPMPTTPEPVATSTPTPTPTATPLITPTPTPTP
jgi:hypothetical protein